MRFYLQAPFLLAFILLFSAFPLRAQERFERDHQKHHHVLQKIERAFKKGKLTLDKKILFKFYAINKSQKLPAYFQARDSLPIKCGTPVVMDFHNNRKKLSPSTIREIELMMEQPSIQAVETYQSGRFLIHYETSGEDAVPPEDLNQNSISDYVEKVAAAADSSYRHEVQSLGYSNPIPAGQTYDIEILDLGFYGQTYITNGTTAIQIENDFEGFPKNTDPEGDVAGAVKATIAHELKHAIQYAATQWDGETDLWAEMDATLMEEVVYDNVNDYYNYLENSDSIFNSPASSFYPGSYYHVSWALYFEENYGPEFWPGVWDIIIDNPDIGMVDAMSEQLGRADTFQRAFAESQLWHFASGPQNSPPNFGFEERELYPSPDINYNFFGDENLTDSLQAFSANYIEVQPSPFSGYAAVTLSDISLNTGLGIIGYFNNGTIESVTFDTEGQQLLNYQTTWKWRDLTKVGIIIANGSENESTGFKIVVRSKNPQIVALEQNYPNPFYPNTIIRFSLTERSDIQLKVYDIAGRLVQTLRNTTLPEGFYEVPFDGSELASGVYFYHLVTDDRSFVKKMTLIK